MSRQNWATKKLNELGYVGRGKSKNRPRNAPFLYGGPFPFVQTGDIKEAGLYIRNYTQTYSEKGLAQSKLWKPGTLCITIAANIAETSVLGIEACFPDSIVGFVANPERADVRFIKYYIDTIKLQMQNISQGTTQDNLSLEKLLSFEILTPPLFIQRRIADILSAYDDLIENNTRRIRILEQMAQSVYRQWFGAVADAVETLHATSLPPARGASLPEGWRMVSFTEIIDVLGGGTPSTSVPEFWDGHIPWFTPRDLTGNFYVFDSAKKITQIGLSKCNSKLYPINTVFITARGTVGKCVLAAVPMAMSQTNYALIGKNGLSQYFVFLLTLSLVDIFKQNATGAVFDTIVTDTFKKQMVVKPPEKLVEQFHELVSPIFKLILTLQQKNANLRKTRDLLLPKLVSGEIAVDDLETKGE